MQPVIVATDLRKPNRALLLITSSMLGPGVAETTKVIIRNNHHVFNAIERSVLMPQAGSNEHYMANQ
jgi:hypothetical protein